LGDNGFSQHFCRFGRKGRNKKILTFTAALKSAIDEWLKKNQKFIPYRIPAAGGDPVWNWRFRAPQRPKSPIPFKSDLKK
jgi:hypothetical protein